MPESQRLKLVISYDGRRFAGWQSQESGNTIQDLLQTAFQGISGRRTAVVGAGRTDAGVHALGQCAHADVPAAKLAAERWLKAVNARLPPAIRVLRTRFVPDTFHARFSAKLKVYRYRIVNSAVLSPFEFGRAWHVPATLDNECLERACQLLIGQHDFAGFAGSRRTPDSDTVRNVRTVSVKRQREMIELEFCAEGFLYKMVRLMTGAIVRCALGKDDLDSIERKLRHPSRSGSRFAAPPSGVYLVRVQY